MCTLIAFHRVWRDAPLFIATNRDERYDRPSGAPQWLGDPPALAPRDQLAGGTWMGANRDGLWVGLTNRRASEPDDPARRSRGLLCLDLLRARSADEVVAALERLEEPYNPFHVVCADAGSLYLIEHEEGRSTTLALGPGCHIVTNEPLGVGDEAKVRRAWSLLEGAGFWPAPAGGTAPQGFLGRLGEILADHGREGRDALCLHGGRHGTRSAAVWRLRPRRGANDPAAFDLLYADGPPCSTPLEAIPWPLR